MPFHHNPADLASRMTRLLGNETHRNDLARRARTRAEAAFNWETITREYEALFAELLRQALSSGVIFLSFWTAQILSSICPTVPAPQMATCTPGWPSAYRRHSVGLRDLSKYALPKTLMAWMPTPRPCP